MTAGMCCYGDGWARDNDGVVVAEHERGTLSAVPVIAHRDCAAARGITPLGPGTRPAQDTPDRGR